MNDACGFVQSCLLGELTSFGFGKMGTKSWWLATSPFRLSLSDSNDTWAHKLPWGYGRIFAQSASPSTLVWIKFVRTRLVTYGSEVGKFNA